MFVFEVGKLFLLCLSKEFFNINFFLLFLAISISCTLHDHLLERLSGGR